MTTVSFAVGNRRLLKLALILDTADAEHRKNKTPTYDQTVTTHPCGTPACALGHWAAAHPRTWRCDADGIQRAGRSMFDGFIEDACAEFGLTHIEATELFDLDGCDNARTAKQAAKFIRKFVARRIRAAKGATP